VEPVALTPRRSQRSARTARRVVAVLVEPPCKADIEIRRGRSLIGDGPDDSTRRGELSRRKIMKCSACNHTTIAHAVALRLGEGAPKFCPSCPVCQAEQKREREHENN
jgi:hypothetical protein